MLVLLVSLCSLSAFSLCLPFICYFFLFVHACCFSFVSFPFAGHFVPNLTFGESSIIFHPLAYLPFWCLQALQSFDGLEKHLPFAFLDCHLMVTNPEKWIADFAKAGASQCTFHVEACCMHCSVSSFLVDVAFDFPPFFS